jgi:Predicted transcriptional regulators containing the CopG/Arc/MetJ DNA-binding domain and a metal-binding domain
MSMNAIKMKQFSIQLPLKMVRALDEIVQMELYASRNEAIRMAIHDLIMEHRDFGHFMNSPKLQKRLRQLEATI